MVAEISFKSSGIKTTDPERIQKWLNDDEVCSYYLYRISAPGL